MDVKIINVINDLADKFGVVIDWTNQNVLPVVKDILSRYVDYLKLEEIIYIIAFSIAFLVMMGICLRTLHETHNVTKFRLFTSSNEVTTEFADALLTIILILTPIVLGAIFWHSVKLVRLNICPEIYMLTELDEMFNIY